METPASPMHRYACMYVTYIVKIQKDKKKGRVTQISTYMYQLLNYGTYLLQVSTCVARVYIALINMFYACMHVQCKGVYIVYFLCTFRLHAHTHIRTLTYNNYVYIHTYMYVCCAYAIGSVLAEPVEPVSVLWLAGTPEHLASRVCCGGHSKGQSQHSPVCTCTHVLYVCMLHAELTIAQSVTNYSLT